MPYAPGVTDISGQLIAQGRLGAANAYSRGIAGITDQYEAMMKKREEDKARLAEARAMENFLKLNGKYLGLNQDTIDEAIRDKPNMTVMEKYSGLAQLTKNAIMKQEMDARNAQIAQANDAVAQNAFMRQQLLAKKAQDDAFNAQLRNLSGLGANLSTATAPQAMPAIDPTAVGSYAGSNAVSGRNVGAFGGTGGMPAAIGLGTAADMLASQRPTNMGGAGVMTPQMTQNVAALAKAQPELMQLSRMGATITPEMASNLINTKMQTSSRDEIAALKLALEQAKMQGSPRFGQTPEGIPYAQQPGGNVIWGPAPVLMRPENARAMEQAKTEGAEQAKADVLDYNDAMAQGAAASESIARLNQIKQLYEHGAKSGWGQTAINTVGSAAARLGIIDQKTQANQELLQRALGEDALKVARTMYKGQGSVSDQERARIDKVTADISKTKAFNVEVVNEAMMLADRAKQVSALASSLRKQGATVSQVADAIRKWKIDNPLPEYGTYKPDLPVGGFRTQAGASAYSKYGG